MRSLWLICTLFALFQAFSHGYVSLHNFGKQLLSSASFHPLASNVMEAQAELKESVIILTPRAQSHMKSLKKNDDALYLRMGVKSGGCSGMSYVMEIIKAEDVTSEDHVEEYEGIKCVVDPKAMLFLYGLKLGTLYTYCLPARMNTQVLLTDYSDELIGGGFKFSNPNADKSW